MWKIIGLLAGLFAFLYISVLCDEWEDDRQKNIIRDGIIRAKKALGVCGTAENF